MLLWQVLLENVHVRAEAPPSSSSSLPPQEGKFTAYDLQLALSVTFTTTSGPAEAWPYLFFFFGPTFTYHYHFKLLSPSAFKPQLCLLICARWFISLAVTFSLHPGLDLDHYLNSHFCQLKKSDVFHIQETKAFYTSDSSKHITKSLGLSCDIWDDNKWKESVPLLYLPAPHHFLWQL